MNWEKTKRMMWWVLIIALLANVPAIAAMQGEEQEKMGTEEQQKKMQERMGEMHRQMMEQRGGMAPLYNADEMMGEEIKSSDGQNVGEIADFMLDLQNDKVCAAILTMNDKLYPVPGYAFAAKTQGQTCTLKLTKEQFMQAPSYSEISEMNLNNADWRQKINDFYVGHMSKRPEMTKGMGGSMAHGEMEYPQGGEMATAWPQRYVFLSDIIGLDVLDTDNEDLAEIENVLFDSKTGYLAYAIVSYGGMWGVGEKLAAVPWTALDVQKGLEYATLDADTAMLGQVTIVEEDIGKLNEPAYARRYYVVFDEEPYWEVFGFVPAMPMSTDAWQAGSSYNRNFDPAKMETIKGKIKSVGSFVPQKGAARGLRLRVETPDGKKMTVYAGPKLYAKMQNIHFKKGSSVEIMGSKATVGDKSVIIASQVTSEGKTLKLRDEQGKPMWNVEDLKEKMQQHKSMHEKSEESKSMY